eukprot:scaffold2117_cov175-Ochromonas_danica.AAC.3
MEDILLSVSSPPEIDLEAFLLWVDGAPVEEAQIMKIDQMKRAFNYPSANGPLLTSFSQTQALLTAAVVTDSPILAPSSTATASITTATNPAVNMNYCIPTTTTTTTTTAAGTTSMINNTTNLLANLRTLRTIYSGEALDHGCLLIRQSIGNQLSKKIDGGQSSLMLGGSKLRNIVKSLLQLGANLAQSREYRDLLEDILTKVVEPLEEANLAAHEMSNFLAACYLLIAELPEKSPAYGSALSTPMTSARISSQHAYFHHTSSVGSINEAAATGQAPPASPYVTSTGSLGPSSTTVTSGSGTENLAAMNSSAMPQGGGQTLSSAAATTLSTINGPLQGGSNNPMISANASSSSGSSVTASGNINANANASSGSQLSISTNFYPNA